jgi:phage terminase small subunit
MEEGQLTAKQEAFALAYVETGNAAEAYRRAYDVKAATQHSTIYSAASRLMSDPKIYARVLQLQEQAASLMMYTVRDAFEEYEAARKLAMAESVSNPSAAVAAVNGKVKLFGLDQPNKVDHTSSDGSMTPKPTVIEFIAPKAADESDN